MGIAKVNLVLTDSETEAITSGLRVEGVLGRRVALEDLAAQSADAFVVDLSLITPHHLQRLLERLSASTGERPSVIALGQLSGTNDVQRAALTGQADAHYPAPYDLGEVVEGICAFLRCSSSAPSLEAPRERTMELNSDPFPRAFGSESGVRSTSLSDVDDLLSNGAAHNGRDVSAMAEREHGAPSREDRAQVYRTYSYDLEAPRLGRADLGAPSSPPVCPPSSLPGQGEGGRFSEEVGAMVGRAHRKLFPGSDPLEVVVPNPDSTADEIVTESLLESIALPLDPMFEETWEHLVLSDVSRESDVPHQDQDSQKLDSMVQDPEAREGSASSGADNGVAVNGVGTEPGDPSGVHVEGRLRPGLLATLLWHRICRRDDSWRLNVQSAEDMDTTVKSSVVVTGVRVVDVRGDVLTRAFGVLRAAQGQLTDVSVDDEAKFIAAVRAQGVSAFDVDRALRIAKEDTLMWMITRSEGTFTLATAETEVSDWMAVVSKGFEQMVSEAAMTHWSDQAVLSWFEHQLELPGDPTQLVFYPREIWERASTMLNLAPELSEHIQRTAGRTLAELCHSANDQQGLLGLVFLLCRIGALHVEAVRAKTSAIDHATTVNESEAVVRYLCKLEEEGSYFEILGVEPTLNEMILRAGYDKRLRSLGFADEEDMRERMNSGALRGSLRRATSVVVEAWDLMSNAQMREAYCRGIQ